MESLVTYDPIWAEPQLKLFPFQPQTLDESVIYESRNDFIPPLDLSMQATEIVEPFLIWGSISRSKYMPGTYAFYCDDYKFEALWNDPGELSITGCQAAVEPNYSLHHNMPLIPAAYYTWRKRHMARVWQRLGIRIFVDMNVPAYHYLSNLYGVPKGWKAYCTRVHKDFHYKFFDDYAVCRNHAGCDPLFVVYGGDNGFARNICERHGWVWIPDKRSAIKWGKYHG